MQALRVLPSRASTLLTVSAMTVFMMAAAILLAADGNRGVAYAATAGPTAGIGAERLGNSYRYGANYGRYSYVNVGVADAAAAGALNTTSIVYSSGTSIPTGWVNGVSFAQAQANNWLLKTASGANVMNTGYGSYIGDFGNPAYQQAFLNWAIPFLTANHDKGIELDDTLCDARGLTGGVYPAKYPNQAAWENAQVSFVAAVGDALKARGFYVMANAVCVLNTPANNSGALDAAFWLRLAPHVNGLMCEYWMQLSSNINQLRVTGIDDWTHFWDGWESLIGVAQNAGIDFFTEMYGTTSSINTMRYGKASFLLDWNGRGGAFIYQPAGNTDPWNLEWTMDIGQPVGARYAVGSGWRRDYTGGTVILNSSGTSSQTFQLGGPYTQANGTTVSSVTLGPAQALILQRSGSSTPPAPINTTLPAISGSGTVGAALSSSAGTWSGIPTSYAYQWQRCNATGGACSPISGATGTQYTPATADVGSTMRSTVVASNAGGSGSATSAPSAVIVVTPPPPTTGPVNLTLPAITGTPQAGKVLASTNGTWSPNPTSFRYAWQRCDSSGANCALSPTSSSALTYTLTRGDIGFRITAQVAPNTQWAASVLATPTAVISGTTPPPPPPTDNPVNLTLPTLSGTAKAGQVLTARNGTWSPLPTSYRYAWHRCNSIGTTCQRSPTTASSPTYTLTSADAGYTIVVQVAANGNWATSVDSKQTATVTP